MTTAPPAKRPGRTLAGIVGGATAIMLLTAVPKEESGRTVQVTVNGGKTTIRHISGPQYLKAYLDLAGVATACDGLTGSGIKVGKTFTETQCAVMLGERLVDTASPIMACAPGLALTVPRRDNVRFAVVDLAYNFGWPRVCRSPIVADINAGRIRAACDGFPKPPYNMVKGRVVAGLTARRQRERTACLKDAA